MAMPRDVSKRSVDKQLCIMSEHEQVWDGQDWSCSRLVEYLSYDYWSPHIGLCTLSGFDHRCCEKGDNSAPSHFNFASALDPGAFMSYKNENSEAEEQLLTRMNEDIDRLRGFWENSGNDIEDRKYPPAFFIEWAISKTFTPDWLKWAIRTGRDIPKLAIATQAGTPAAKVKEDTSRSGDDWRVQARAIADECFDLDTKGNCRDSLARKKGNKIVGGYSFRVMGLMQERGIKGPRGIIDNPATIMREALQGAKWWVNKSK